MKIVAGHLNGSCACVCLCVQGDALAYLNRMKRVY